MSRAKSTSRQAERRNQRRHDILEVANRLFSALGYENVTLRAVAEELGYTHATLYRYFPDKSHLLAEICRETFARLVVDFDAAALASADPVERLFETSRGFVRFSLDHPQHFRTVFFGPEERAGGVTAGHYINEVGRPLFERIVRVFIAGAAASGRPVADPNLAAHAWWSAIIGLTMVLVVQGEVPGLPTPASLLEQLLSMLWAGLQGTASAQKPPTPARRASRQVPQKKSRTRK